MIRTYHINPTDDPEFVALVARLGPDACDPAALQALLRATHPAVVVRAWDLDGMESVRWYVYREGTWVPRTGPRLTHPPIDGPSSVETDDVTGSVLPLSQASGM
jgi:hypothetical protein